MTNQGVKIHLPSGGQFSPAVDKTSATVMDELFGQAGPGSTATSANHLDSG
jgi:hypothetical protein